MIRSLLLATLMLSVAGSFRIASADPRAYQLAIGLADGPTIRHFDERLDAVDCDRVDDWVEDRNAAQRADTVHVCARDTAAGLDLQVEWDSRRGTALTKRRSSTTVALGKPVTIGRTGGPQLTVTVR